MQVSSSEMRPILQLSLHKSPLHNNKSLLRLALLQKSGLQRKLFSRLCQKCSVKMKRLYKRTLKRQRKNLRKKRRKLKKRRKARKRPSSQEKLQKLKRRNRVEKRKN